MALNSDQGVAQGFLDQATVGDVGVSSRHAQRLAKRIARRDLASIQNPVPIASFGL